nr:MAG TPA: hypothetical protein [Caudoviricetes sp.]
MEALMCLFGIAIGAGLVTGLWCVAKFAARNMKKYGSINVFIWNSNRCRFGNWFVVCGKVCGP